MAAEFSVSSHTTYFAGYLDAVGRQFSTASQRCNLAVQVMPSTMLDRFSVKSAHPVERMIGDFQHDICKFLGADPKAPLLFYLIEYFSWYNHFSDVCSCEKLSLEGEGLSPDHFAYRLKVNNQSEVVFLASWGTRGHG
jgi:hypothetical protein